MLGRNRDDVLFQTVARTDEKFGSIFQDDRIDDDRGLGKLVERCLADFCRVYTIVLKIILQFRCLKQLNGVSRFVEIPSLGRRVRKLCRLLQKQIHKFKIETAGCGAKGYGRFAVAIGELLADRLQIGNGLPVGIECRLGVVHSLEQSCDLPLPLIERFGRVQTAGGGGGAAGELEGFLVAALVFVEMPQIAEGIGEGEGIGKTLGNACRGVKRLCRAA